MFAPKNIPQGQNRSLPKTSQEKQLELVQELKLDHKAKLTAPLVGEPTKDRKINGYIGRLVL